jgi:ribosomal protein S18 acetylase RimI-like enzyme
MNRTYSIRPATSKDLNFIVETIIQAEKSGTPRCGMALLFGISESELRTLLKCMLEEEIDGCELSLSSFIVADYAGKAVGAIAGWIEGGNEDKSPSYILKSNLLGYYIPKKNIQLAASKSPIIKGIQIERKQGTYQIEYAYVENEHRGNNLTCGILEEHSKRAGNAKKMFLQVFPGNISAIKSYKRFGFHEDTIFHSSNPLCKNILPDDTKLLMAKYL